MLGYVFNDPTLLDEAMTLPYSSSGVSYRRLAFLGDRVLGVVVAERLYTNCPDLRPEGLSRSMDRVVSNASLRRIADSMGLGRKIVRAKGMQAREAQVLAGIFEAVIAAIFLDCGRSYDTVRGVLEPLLFPDTAPAQRAEKVTEPTVVAEAPALSVEDVGRLSRLLDATPPLPNDFEEATNIAPDYDFAAVTWLVVQDPVERVREVVLGVTGTVPLFRKRRNGVEHRGKVVVDVVLGYNGSSRHLGSGQGRDLASASHDAAEALLRDNAKKLRRSLSA